MSIENMSVEEYWLGAESCFSCGGDLKKEDREDARVLVCKTCSVVNASIEGDKNNELQA